MEYPTAELIAEYVHSQKVVRHHTVRRGGPLCYAVRTGAALAARCWEAGERFLIRQHLIKSNEAGVLRDLGLHDFFELDTSTYIGMLLTGSTEQAVEIMTAAMHVTVERDARGKARS